MELQACFRQAVAAIHSPDPLAAQSWRGANAWLVTFSDDPRAGQVCQSVLQSSQTTLAEQTFAAGILARAAKGQGTSTGTSTAVELLHLCKVPACLQAVSSLAPPIAQAAVANKAEDQLLQSSAFCTLEPPRQLLLLHALADALCQAASVEELRHRPTAVSACKLALGLLQDALLPPALVAPPSDALPAAAAMDPATSLRCLCAWASCGVDIMTLGATYPAITNFLLLALQPHSVLIQGGRAQDATLLNQASLAASVFGACLQCTLDAAEDITLVECAPLLGTLAHWAPPANTDDVRTGSSANVLVLNVAMLGVPTFDGHGMSDGGGEFGNVSIGLACGLASVASVALEALAEDIDSTFASVHLPGCGEATQLAARHARSVMELLLACSSHPCTAVAEVAAEGWLYFARSQPAPAAPFSWAHAVFRVVVQRTTARCSRAQLRQGTGDDGEDLAQWRERSARPLLNACSELLGIEAWLTTIAEALRSTLADARVQGAMRDPASVPIDHNGVETLEAFLFAAACTSPSCLRACPPHVECGLLAEVKHAAQSLTTCAAFMGDGKMAFVTTQAHACVRILAGESLHEDDDDDDDADDDHNDDDK